MAVLKLGGRPLCPASSPRLHHQVRCVFGLAALMHDDYPGNFKVAGYGHPANSMSHESWRLMVSSKCNAPFLSNLGYGYVSCETNRGMSGAPFYMYGDPYAFPGGEPDFNKQPTGTIAFTFPAVGVHVAGRTDIQNSNIQTSAVELMFTPAHLRWLYYAGAHDAYFYTCTSSKNYRRFRACTHWNPGKG